MKYANFTKAWDYVPNSRHHRHCPKGHYAVPDDVAEAAKDAGVLDGDPTDAPKGTRTGDLYEAAPAPEKPVKPTPTPAPAPAPASGSAAANAGG